MLITNWALATSSATVTITTTATSFLCRPPSWCAKHSCTNNTFHFLATLDAATPRNPANSLIHYTLYFIKGRTIKYPLTQPLFSLFKQFRVHKLCLLYTSDAADEEDSV